MQLARGRSAMCGGMTLAVLLVSAPHLPAACVGDCHADGAVTVDELVIMVDAALGNAQVTECPAGDRNDDGEISVDEIIDGVSNLLSSCPSETTPTPSPTQNGILPVATAVARDAGGVARLLGQTITTEGVVTVAAGIFANNKLKVFIQDGDAGIMVYHQSSAAVEAFQPGQRLRAMGLVRQQDPTADSNPAIGTVAVDISSGSAVVLSEGSPLPIPWAVTLATLNANGTSYTGTLVRVGAVQKTSGSWPALGSRSTQVEVSDDSGASVAVVRFQRNTITAALVNKLTAIGDGPFTLSGIVVQDDAIPDGTLLSGFEIWIRGEGDVGE